jgi:iron complex transport system substrate-binding protein
MRIVSLLASATEVVCALGAGEYLVGRSHECDNPSWVRSLPQLSEPAFDISVSSGDIDSEVRRRLRAGEPLYRIQAQRIRELKPDFIFTQSHCEVCAVTPGDVERNGAYIPGAHVVTLSACSVEEVFDCIHQIAETLGLAARGHALVAEERARLRRLGEAVAEFQSRSVAVLEWTDPIFPMGNWGPELVDAAGGKLVLGNRGQHSFAIAAEQLAASDPEYLVVAPCGFNLERTTEELPVLERHLWWSELRAVRHGKVAFADGNLLFNRSGMTVVRSAEILAEILHGVVTGKRSEGRHWLWTHDIRAARTSTVRSAFGR